MAERSPRRWPGSQPQDMSPLPSNNTKTITETLADPATASVRGLSMISQKSLVVSLADTYNFSYSLLPDSLQQPNCQNQNICYTCRYDLTITITDNCNNQLLGRPALRDKPAKLHPGYPGQLLRGYGDESQFLSAIT